MADVVVSRSGIRIRLTDERWAHIIEEHGEILGLRPLVLDTVALPDRVLGGAASESLAVKEIEPGKWLVVVYREDENDGFIITAFLTRRRRSLERRQQLWP